jgi:essential recombination function protein
MSIYEKLGQIQKTLKAPKNQRNKFGGYNYRSCEDILEAVKPLLDGCVLTVSDEVVSLGDRFYIKATARLALSGDEFVENTAWAREPETKKGMDEAQITGATSSYARKYALNGLLAIDDTKDADALNKEENNKAFEKAAAAEKAAQTKATNAAIKTGGEYIAPKQQQTLEERYKKALSYLKTQTSFKSQSVVDSINTLLMDLKKAGTAGWHDDIMAEYNRLSAIDDFIPDGGVVKDYRV